MPRAAQATVPRSWPQPRNTTTRRTAKGITQGCHLASAKLLPSQFRRSQAATPSTAARRGNEHILVWK